MHSVMRMLSNHHRSAFKLKRERINKCLMYMKRYIPCSILPLSFKCRRNKKVRSDLVVTITRKWLFVLLWMWYCSSLTILLRVRMKLKQCCWWEGPSPWWEETCLPVSLTTLLWKKPAAPHQNLLRKQLEIFCLSPETSQWKIPCQHCHPTGKAGASWELLKGVSCKIEFVLMAHSKAMTPICDLHVI